MTDNWYNIKAEASTQVVDVYIFDEVGTYGISAQSFIQEIKAHKNNPMNIHINSIGGDVFEGMAIYNVLKKRAGKTTVYVEGLAASIGSVIALAADEVIMSSNSLFMIHNAWGGAMGEATEMRKTANLLEKISNEIADIYRKKTNLPYDKIQDMMNEETWLNAQEAYELGFIDSISDAIKVAAKYDISKFKNITNEEIQTKLNINLKRKTMTEELKNWFNAKIDDIIATVKSDNVKAKTVEVTLADETEISKKFTEFEAKVDGLNGVITDLEGQKTTLTEEVEKLNALINKADAKGSEVTTESDPNVREEKVVDANTAGFNALLAKLNTHVSR